VLSKYLPLSFIVQELLVLLLTLCGLGLGGSVHEEAHPCFPYLVQPSFKGIDAGSIYHPMVQRFHLLINSVRKKIQQSRVHRNLTSFLEFPVIPLVLSARVKNSFNFNLDSSLHILKTLMRSKRLDESSWFLEWRRILGKFCFKKIQFLQTRVFLGYAKRC